MYTLTPFIVGLNVTLCVVSPEMAPLLTRWINDPEIRLCLSHFFPMMEEGERDWILSLKNNKGNAVFVIVVDGKPIGMMGLHSIDHIHGTAITGAFIGEREYQDRGYGTEAKMLLLNYAFNTLNLRKISSRVYAFNTRSIRYSEKCGYEHEATLKKQIFRKGKYWDEVLLAVFRTKWQKHWKKFVKENKISV